MGRYLYLDEVVRNIRNAMPKRSGVLARDWVEAPLPSASNYAQDSPPRDITRVESRDGNMTRNEWDAHRTEVHAEAVASTLHTWHERADDYYVNLSPDDPSTKHEIRQAKESLSYARAKLEAALYWQAQHLQELS